MPTGTVKWFDESKGYGFIVPDEEGADLFVHYSGIACGGYKKLDEGARVRFEIDQSRDRPAAIDVEQI